MITTKSRKYYSIICFIILLMFLKSMHISFEPSYLTILAFYYILFPLVTILLFCWIVKKQKLNKEKLLQQGLYCSKLIVLMIALLASAFLVYISYLNTKLFAYYLSNTKFSEKVLATKMVSICGNKGPDTLDFYIVDMKTKTWKIKRVNRDCALHDSASFPKPTLVLLSGRESFLGRFYEGFTVVSEE